MEKQEIVNLLRNKYKNYLDNDDLEGLIFDIPVNIRPEVVSFLMYDVGMDLLGQITEIPEKMLYGSAQVDKIIIPKDIKSIGESAFANSSITGFDIEDGGKIEEIPSRCFEGCDDLKTVKFPISVTKIGVDAFKGCSNLTQVITPHRNKRNQKIAVFGGDKEILQPLLTEQGE